MDKYRQISELIGGFNNSGPVFYPAIIESIEGISCTVNIDGLSVSEVRLKPTTTKTKNQLLIIPSIGSHVLVGSYSGDYANLFVLASDVVDKIEITCNGQNVMGLISDWLKTLAESKIIVGKSTGTFEPSVISKLNQIENAFKEIFK